MIVGMRMRMRRRMMMMMSWNEPAQDAQVPVHVRSDLEHQVNHNVKTLQFYHVFSSYEEGGPTGAGKTRCLAVYTVKHGKAKKWEWQGRMPTNSRSTSTINANWPTRQFPPLPALYTPFTGCSPQKISDSACFKGQAWIWLKHIKTSSPWACR